MRFPAFMLPIFALVAVVSGCASTEVKNQSMQAHLKCVSNQAVSMDDGKGGIGDIAMAAVYACRRYEDEIMSHYPVGGEAARSMRLTLQQGAYPVAVRSITSRRKEVAATPKNSDPCVYTFVYESCHKVGVAKKSDQACTWIATKLDEDAKRTYSDIEKVNKLHSLCNEGCGDGMFDRPMRNYEMLCKG